MKLLLLLALPFLALGTLHAAAPENVTPQQAEQLMKDKKDLVILDVRTPEEFGDGHLAGATNLNIFDPEFAAKLKALDPSKTYLVHCAAGSRSQKAVNQMDAFAHVYHMNGGYHAWEKAGLPVEKAK